MITEEKVRAIMDMPSLLAFMSQELEWNLPAQPALDEVTFDWIGSEVNLSDDASRRLGGGTIKQLRPFRPGQPWGIFLIDFVSSRISTVALRQIIRRLVPSRRASRPDLPAWHCPNILFICTCQNQHFTFAHFSGEKVERARLTTFSWSPEEPLRTLCEFNLPAIKYEPDWDDATWLKQWQTAFDVEKVTKRFFEDYQKIFRSFQDILFKQANSRGSTREAKAWAHDYALQFLNRLMFLYFIQKKRWLGDNPRFILHFWNAYRNSQQPPDSFFKNWLSVLFFEAFSEQYKNLDEYTKRFPQEIHQALSQAPFLNGGLFTRNDLDKQFSFSIPDSTFELLFDQFESGPGFFERYNFTISETTPLDQEVAVDPEMIGKVYESLVNITFEGISEQDLRGTAGIFFTPRIELDLMCRLALVDYLANYLGNSCKPLFYEAVFAYSPEEKEVADARLARQNLWPQLDELLHDITVLDPACGSGSFLIGMLLVLDDLIARADSQLGRRPQTQFVRRKEIIANSLYGVDVMPWSVHVAELRLWLQLIVETEHEWYEMKAEPMLPNLSFKVRPGDSLIQEVGGINFGLHHADFDIPSHLKGKLTQLKGEKLKFYRNDPTARFKDEKSLKQEELKIFRELLEARVQKLENEIKSLTLRIETPVEQAVMPGMEPKVIQAPLDVQKWRDERRKLQDELAQAQKARDALAHTQEPPFVWDMAFVEIFRGDKQGFDIVIGNPPYVGRDKIAPPTERPEDHGGEDSDTWKAIKQTYKSNLQQSVYAAYPRFFGYNPAQNTVVHKLDGQTNYYIYFYFDGLNLLNDKGSFCFITSNSWLDVGYGKDLQEFLLKHCHIKMILDNEKKRTFAQADVNTIIALFSAANAKADYGTDKKAHFVMFKAPFEEVLSPIVFQEIEDAEKLSTDRNCRQLQVPIFGTNETLILAELSRPEFRARVVKQADLYRDGLGSLDEEINLISDMAKYSGGKWGGKYLRAPEIFWTVIQKGKHLATPLSEYFRGERYMNTGGADGFFILTDVNSCGKHLFHLVNNAITQPSLKPFNGEIEEKYLAPLVKDYTKSDKRIEIHGHDAYCLVIKEQPSPKLIRYIDWGEIQKYHRRSVTRSQRPWYKPTQQMTGAASILVPRSFNDSFVIHYNPRQYLSLRYYRLHCKKGNETQLVAFLNSTLIAFVLEVLGNKSLGQGVLDFFMADFLGLKIPVVEKPEMETIFEQLKERPIQSICEELGLPAPNEDYSNVCPEDVSLDKVLPDRRELDKIVFEAIGLTEQEQLEVYRAVVELVKNRLAKARSV